jgi:hypothetical protein
MSKRSHPESNSNVGKDVGGKGTGSGAGKDVSDTSGGKSSTKIHKIARSGAGEVQFTAPSPASEPLHASSRPISSRPTHTPSPPSDARDVPSVVIASTPLKAPIAFPPIEHNYLARPREVMPVHIRTCDGVYYWFDGADFRRGSKFMADLADNCALILAPATSTVVQAFLRHLDPRENRPLPTVSPQDSDRLNAELCGLATLWCYSELRDVLVTVLTKCPTEEFVELCMLVGMDDNIDMSNQMRVKAGIMPDVDVLHNYIHNHTVPGNVLDISPLQSFGRYGILIRPPTIMNWYRSLAQQIHLGHINNIQLVHMTTSITIMMRHDIACVLRAQAYTSVIIQCMNNNDKSLAPVDTTMRWELVGFCLEECERGISDMGTTNLRCVGYAMSMSRCIPRGWSHANTTMGLPSCGMRSIPTDKCIWHCTIAFQL